MERKIVEKVTGYRTTDGAGVSLVRVLGANTIRKYSPFLMLDSFDSTNPEDYIKGFPMHPHRGMETITYLVKGEMEHKDSLGNSGTIHDGEAQWMTAGSGILHEEMPKPADRMLGVQIWLNLSAKDKWVSPSYNDVQNLKLIDEKDFKVRIVAGNYKNESGFQAKYVPVNFLDYEIYKDKEVTIDTNEDWEAYLFLLEGNVYINDELVDEKTAVSFTKGDKIRIKSEGEVSRVLFLNAPYLDEPVAWGGPIVMNTREELQQAFRDLNEGNFIKENANK